MSMAFRRVGDVENLKVVQLHFETTVHLEYTMITRKHGGGRKCGVRHLQLIFASVHCILDGVGLVGLLYYIQDVRKGDVDGTLNEERLFTENELQLTEAGVFLTSAISTVMSPYVVLTVNNKYQGIFLSVVEALIYGSIMHIYKLLKFYGVVTLCVLLTLCQNVRFPLALNTIAKWIPPREYTRAVTIVRGGTYFGRSFVVFLLMAPVMRNYLFYILACLKGAHSVVYFFFGAQDPQTCWILRKNEWHYLCREIGLRRKIECNWKLPWTTILQTPILYGLMCSAIASAWFFVDFMHFDQFVPGYHYTVNVSIMVYPFLLFGVSWGVDVMIYKDFLTRNNVRKICNAFVFWGTTVAICFMCFHNRDSDKVVVYFIIASYFSLGSILCQTATTFDMSPNYAVELHVLHTFPSWIFAAIKITLVDPQFPLPGAYPFKDHLSVWYITAFLNFVLSYGFLMFGDVSWCQFDTFNAVDWRKESQISYP